QLKNEGSAISVIERVDFEGEDAESFSATQTCVRTMLPYAMCQFTVTGTFEEERPYEAQLRLHEVGGGITTIPITAKSVEALSKALLKAIPDAVILEDALSDVPTTAKVRIENVGTV